MMTMTMMEVAKSSNDGDDERNGGCGEADDMHPLCLPRFGLQLPKTLGVNQCR